jgi:hypothetical protein
VNALIDPHPDDMVSPADMVFMALAGNAPPGQRIAVAARTAQTFPAQPVQPPSDAVGSLSGRVFHDADGDGKFAEGDEGIAGAQVLLVGKTARGQPVRGATKTRPDGQFLFDGLPAGTYTVFREGVSPLGRARVGMINGVAVGEAVEHAIGRVVMPPGGTAEGYSFAEVRPATVSGVVLLEDEDEDGPIETPAEGVTVLLTGVDGRGRVVQQSTKADARGGYRFAGLYPGHYDIYAAPSKGQSNTRARPGDRGGRASGAGKITALALPSGAHATGYNFTLRRLRG